MKLDQTETSWVAGMSRVETMDGPLQEMPAVPEETALIVRGDLVLAGPLDIRDNCALVVLGNVTCASFVVANGVSVSIRGTLTTRRAIAGAETYVRIGGRCTTEVFLALGGAVVFARVEAPRGRLVAGTPGHFTIDGQPSTRLASDDVSALVAELLDDEGCVADPYEVIDRVIDGRAVVRD
jgi:hypothetical protein